MNQSDVNLLASSQSEAGAAGMLADKIRDASLSAAPVPGFPKLAMLKGNSGDLHVSTLEQFNDAPNRMHGNRQFSTAAGFCAYVQASGKHADDFPIHLYALAEAAKSGDHLALARAVLNPTDAEGNGWEDWTADLVAPLHKIYCQWAAIFEKGWLNQQQFGEFLEERAGEVVEPQAADIKEIVLNVEGAVGGTFKSRKNLQNGDLQLVFSEATTTTLEIPGKLVIEIPFFPGQPVQRVEIRLRFRANGGNVQFALMPIRLDETIRAATQAMVSEAETVLGISAWRVRQYPSEVRAETPLIHR